MTKKDLFYKDVEGRMEELKQGALKKEKPSQGEKISKTFSILLGLLILISLIFTLLGILRCNDGSFDDCRHNPSRRLDCPDSHPTSPKPTLFHGCDQQYRKTRLLAEQSLGKSFNSLD